MIAQASTNSLRIVAIAVVSAAVVGCASEPVAVAESRHEVPAAPERPQSRRQTKTASAGERAALIALQQVGVPYRYGGTTRSGFDCSGLVQYAYAGAGVRLPRTTGQQWQAAATVPRESIQAGDLVFFNIEGKMSHVGLYIGDDKFVHAPSSGRHVSVERLDAPFYAAALARVARPE